MSGSIHVKKRLSRKLARIDIRIYFRVTNFKLIFSLCELQNEHIP